MNGAVPFVTPPTLIAPFELPQVEFVDVNAKAVGPDVLEINTLTRDVFLNGSYENARAKLDVLTDFFFLEPSNNVIEFTDDKNSVSTGLLKVFYRSGWLG